MTKIFATGSECPMCQIDRIRQGFEILGYELTNNIEDADLVYCNNPPFDKLNDWKIANPQKAAKKKFIYCVLDIPVHIAAYNLANLYNGLILADKVVSISKTTQSLLKSNLNMDSSVIYNPIKDVEYRPLSSRNFRFGLAGRISDPNKRCSLGLEALMALGVSKEEIGAIGGEYMPFVTNLGIISDDDLSNFYSGLDFLICPSKYEGMLLPALEACICGAIPVLATDCGITHEFYSDLSNRLEAEFGFRLDKTEPTVEAIQQFISSLMYDMQRLNGIKSFIREYSLSHFWDQYNKVRIASNIIWEYNRLLG